MTHKTAALVALIGGVAAAVGAFLPWAEVRSGIFTESLNGMTGDGPLIIAAGAVGAILALIHLEKPAPTPIRAAVIAAGVAVGVIAWASYQNIQKAAATSEATITIGVGLLVIGAGAAAMVIGGTQMTRVPDTDVQHVI